MILLAFLLSVGIGAVGLALGWLHLLRGPERAREVLGGIYEHARPAMKEKLREMLLADQALLDSVLEDDEVRERLLTELSRRSVQGFA